MTRKLWHAAPLALVVALLLSTAAYAIVVVTTAVRPAPITLTPDRTSVSLPAGGHSPIGIKVGYTGPSAIVITVAGLPRGGSARVFTAAQPRGAFEVVDFAVYPTVRPGTYAVTVTATAGQSRAQFRANIIVRPYGLFTPRLEPPLRTSHANSTTDYGVFLEGYRYIPGPRVALNLSGLPAGTRATWSATTVTASSGKVHIHLTFGPNVKAGIYPLTLTGTAGREVETARAYLVLYTVPPTKPSQSNFIISGSASPALSPGSTSPINLSITNLASTTMNVSSLTTQLTATSRAGCTTANFTIQQFSGSYPLQIPANATRTLGQLGVPQAEWPSVTMLDLPVNQDVCKSTALSLTYAGQGSGQ